MSIEEQPVCVLCGEKIPQDQMAEMYGEPRWYWGVPNTSYVTEGIVHDQCGLNAGWEVS